MPSAARSPSTTTASRDLLICKALFDRSKDWVDIEAVAKTRRGDLDRPYITEWLGRFLPADDPRRARIAAMLD